MDINQPNSASSMPYKRSNHRSKTVARKKRSLGDYEFAYSENSKVKTSDLGAGAYGSVKRVREKATGQIFAMKIMSKQNIFRYSNKENLRREIHIQRSILHPHIIALKHYFEDLENVYIVMEYAENGTLFEHIRRKKRCSENESFIYFFQTALALDYLHKRNIIHRDLKPENLLLDKSGNIKVCDFGWSAEAENIKRHTFCGTIDYMAPEMIKNFPHDYHIDIWSLGVLLYELLHGRAPFQGKNDQEKCKNIAKNAGITFDSSLSPEVCDLISKILKPNPLERLEMIEIFHHPWMKKFEAIYKIDILSYVIQQDSATGEISLLNDSTVDSPHGSVGDVDRKASGEQREPSLERHVAKSQFATTHNEIKTSLGQISTKESDVNSRPGSGVEPSSSSSRIFPFEVENEKSKKFVEDSYRIAYHGPNKTDQERSRSKFLQTIQTEKDYKRFRSAGRENIPNLYRKDSGGEAKGKRNYVYYNDSFDNKDDDKSLKYLYKRNQEIEQRFQHFKNPKKEPTFFEKLLMGIGCISRDTNAHLDI